MMLARHAEDLFWMGRYLERAEQTARVIDVNYHAALEAGSARSSAEIWSDLAESLSIHDEPDLASNVEEALIIDRESSASIASIVSSARENARSTREWLSSEVWESINDLHLTMRRADLSAIADGRPYGLLRGVKSGCQTITGAALASMPRSTGYRFYLLGVMLERALATSRVLAVWHSRLATSDERQAFAEWQKLLRTVSAHEAFLRAHKATFEVLPVLTFLLQSRTFPRSVLYALSSIEGELEAISRDGVGLNARRAVGRLRADVEFCDLVEVDDDQLADMLAAVERGIGEAALQIEHDYFRPAHPDRDEPEGVEPELTH